MSKSFNEEGVVNSVHPPIPQGHEIKFALRTCEICGCTEKAPCFDGEQVCFWVTMNSQTNAGLCSECIGF